MRRDVWSMSILKRLKALKGETSNDRIILESGQLSISDWTFNCWLFRFGIDDSVRKELMLEPLESRDGWLYYYERRYE
jgi:hypothetical protein